MDVPPKARTTDVYRLLDNPDIEDREIRLWLWYRRHHIDDRGAYVSDAATIKALGWGPRKVQQVRAELVANGLLKIVRRGPKPQAYFPLPLAKDSQDIAPQDSHVFATQNRKDSHDDSQNLAPPYRRTVFEPY